MYKGQSSCRSNARSAPIVTGTAVKTTRGNKKVESDHVRVILKPFQYLVAAAREGKLDPVIGRDKEVRRVIQILSRRRKNNPVLIRDPGDL